MTSLKKYPPIQLKIVQIKADKRFKGMNLCKGICAFSKGRDQ